MQPPGPIFVLVVDDDKYSRVFMQRFVPAPARTAGAANGHEALAAVMKDPPDVVLMDLEMPLMGGLDAAARIREWERREGRARCAMIAMSSHDDDESVRARIFEAGFDGYLTKPVSRDALRRALSECIVSQATILADADLKDVLPGFLEASRTMAGELEQAIAESNAERIRALAHKLAGSLMLYGFDWAAERSKMIERRAGENALTGLAADAAELRRHLDGVRVRVE